MCAQLFADNMEWMRDCPGSGVIRLTVVAEGRLGEPIMGLVNSYHQLELMQ